MNEDKIEEFLNSYDFMRLGQVLSCNDQNMAMMIITKLQNGAANAGLTDIFAMNLQGIRQCIIGNDMRQALDILAVVTAKRVKMLEERNQFKAKKE